MTNTLFPTDTAPETTLLGADLKRYNGTLTVTNPATGQHRTFRIKTVLKGDLKGMRVLQLLTGQNNETDYRGFAFVQPTGRVSLWKKFAGTDFAKLAMIVERADWYAEHRGLEYQFAVRCRRCNRLLTDPESIDAGIGSYCREVV